MIINTIGIFKRFSAISILLLITLAVLFSTILF